MINADMERIMIFLKDKEIRIKEFLNTDDTDFHG